MDDDFEAVEAVHQALLNAEVTEAGEAAAVAVRALRAAGWRPPETTDGPAAIRALSPEGGE